MKRRRFLQAGLASSVLAGTGGLSSRAYAGEASNGKVGERGSAKNVIFLVSDGMSTGTLTMADQYLRWRDDRPSNWIALLEEGVGKRGLVDTSSANSIVTDSAAGASSWGCGHRVLNGAVNIDPQGEPRPPIHSKAREAGLATALVTTTQLTHATPAGFAANVPSRGHQHQIATQLFERKIDVLLGGGQEHFTAGDRPDDVDLFEKFASAGYAVARKRAELDAIEASAKQVFGCFGRGHLPYELDRVNSDSLKADVPSLAELTTKALEILTARGDGFVMQVEGGRVDHAAHANDIGGLIFDQIAFDEAVGVAVEYARNRDDTLVILTTDHGNAHPGLNSGGNGGERPFETLTKFTGTHSPTLEGINGDSTVDDIRDRIEEVTKIRFTSSQARTLKERLNDEWAAAYGRMNGTSAVLGQLIANHTDIGWVGNYHTSDYVEAWTYGPCSERLKYMQDNTTLHDMMTHALDLQDA
ncbi:MAG: alkaline phosphatase [Phycisphaeraceae bacterium]